MNPFALVALSACAAAMIGAAAAYFVRVRMPRPPVGVYAASDIAFLSVGVVVAPLLYLSLSGAAVSAVFGLVLGLAVQFTLAPVCGGPWAWAPALAATAVTAACAFADRPVAVRVCMDLLLVVAVVGVANLWAQSGMRPVHVAAFAAVLTGYDLVATTLTRVTLDFATQVQGRPFAPMFALTGGDRPVAIGLGDLLLLVLFPLVATRAFGRRAGLLAAFVGVGVTGVVSALFAVGALTAGFPLLTLLGPLIVAQHLVWTRRFGGERRTVDWRAGTPVRARPRDEQALPAAELTAALAVPVPDGSPEGTWFAVGEGRVLATGPTPGQARRAAGRQAPEVPVVIRMV
ncbi:hypothetical protein ABZ829_33135 [Streptomyces xanthochromogenes]|uniref:hypothetical protein n=1 Tax=Streptomyces xanthochromogenes TaxID=67384 RepID=UPI003444723F